jgi:hypothetical protein
MENTVTDGRIFGGAYPICVQHTNFSVWPLGVRMYVRTHMACKETLRTDFGKLICAPLLSLFDR